MAKREWGVTDPFQFPPNEFHYGLLRAVEPFLRVHKGPRDFQDKIRNNKFQGGQMRRDTLEACMHIIGLELPQFERSYKEELGFRPRHLEMMRQVEKFTLPHDDVERAFLPAVTGEGDDQEQKGFFIAGPEQGEDEEVTDSTGDSVGSVTTAGAHTPSSSSSSGDDQSDYHLDTEAAPQGPEDVPGKDRTDCRGFVYNEGPRAHANEEERDLLTPQRCVFIAEFKPDENDNAIPQAAAAGRLEVRRNLANRHFKPMHLIALSRTKFTYAVLKVQGYILAGGQYVTDAAYESFLQTTEPGSSPYSKEQLNQRLESGTTFLRENYRSRSRPTYTRRPYIVGDLYVVPNWYMLPSNEIYLGMVSPGATSFYEGLLRIVIGDRILKASVADVIERVSRRMVQTLRQANNGGLAASKMVQIWDLVLQRASPSYSQPSIQEAEEPDRPVKRPRGNSEL